MRVPVSAPEAAAELRCGWAGFQSNRLLVDCRLYHKMARDKSCDSKTITPNTSVMLQSVSEQCSFAPDKYQWEEREVRIIHRITESMHQPIQSCFHSDDGSCWPMLRPAVRLGTMYASNMKSKWYALRRIVTLRCTVAQKFLPGSAALTAAYVLTYIELAERRRC